MEYDIDNFHIEIDNEVAELGVTPLEALDIWKDGAARFLEAQEQPNAVEPNHVALCRDCGSQDIAYYKSNSSGKLSLDR